MRRNGYLLRLIYNLKEMLYLIQKALIREPVVLQEKMLAE